MRKPQKLTPVFSSSKDKIVVNYRQLKILGHEITYDNEQTLNINGIINKCLKTQGYRLKVL